MDDQAFQLLMSKLEDHDRKLDELLAWKWKTGGIAVVLSTIAGIAVQFLIAH